MENEILPRTEDLAFWLFWLGLVIILLLRDVVKACMRRAFWFPGQALVLSALIFQLLSFVDYSNISVYSGSSYEEKEVSAILVINQPVIDSGRIMMYVLTAYLLPGMARSGSISDASTLAVLALTITYQVVFQVRSHWKVEKRNESEGFDRIISYLCSTILILAIIYLLCLLMRAIMVGRTIRRIMSQKIRSALSCRAPDGVPRFDQTKYHVLKCWIVARLSQPDYVLARAGFCSMVCRIVTACIVLHGINLRHVQFTDNESLNSVTQRKLVLFVIVCQFVIVLIGWIVLFFRGWISVLHRDISSGDYLNSVSIEDALTDFCNYKRIQEQKLFQLFPVRLVQKLFQLSPVRLVQKLLLFPVRLVQKLLLFPVRLVQKLVQFLTVRLVQKLVQFLTARFVPIASYDEADFEMYQPILNKLQIGGERALSLWEANQQGFNRVKAKIEQMEQGRQADVLTGFLRGAGVESVKELQQYNKNSWKRTAVSLIKLMIYDNGQDDDIREAMTGYTQAWEYMHFVDGLDVEVKSFGWKTDKEFDRLEDTWNKREEEPGKLQSEIRDPLDKLRALSPEQQDDLQNSRDSAKVAEYCLIQTFLHPYLPGPGRFRRELADVYFFCMTEYVNETILEKCCKLAEEGREEEILDVAFLAAKAHAVLAKVGKEHDLEDPVELRHNADPVLTSSPIQTETELAGNNSRNTNASGNTMNANASAGTGDGIHSLRPTETAAVREGRDTDQASTSSRNQFENKQVGEGNGQAGLPPMDEFLNLLGVTGVPANDEFLNGLGVFNNSFPVVDEADKELIRRRYRARTELDEERTSQPLEDPGYKEE